MRGRKWKELTCLSVLLFLAMTPVVSRADVLWTAYNDCLTQVQAGIDPLPHPNVTSWTIHNDDPTGLYTGPLKDIDTGSTQDMPTVTFSMEVGINPSSVSRSSGGNPDVGTPAYDIFGGIIEFRPNIIGYTSFGWAQIIEFSNLDPGLTYTFAGTAIRRRDYPDRKTLVTISGHDSAANNSSSGPMIVQKTDDTTIFKTGNNTSPGDVVRWDEIMPGADGKFTIRAEATADSSSGYKAYAINGFMLQATGTLGNRPPNVDAGEDQQITLPIRSVTMNATVTDDGLGDPDGYLAYQWSKISGPKDVTFEPDVNEKNPTVRFTPDGAGVYVLRLNATDGDLDNSDEITITVHPPDCPLGDLSGDCLVDHGDLYIFGLQWLSNPAGNADLSGDDLVDYDDYKWVAESWRQNWQTGSLRVSIDPEKARGDGAQWRVDGGPTWHNHDYIEEDLSIATHTVEFRTIADWDKPDDQEVDVAYGVINEASGTYIEHTGSLQVNISPPDVLPEAKWRRVGEITWRDSGGDGREDDIPVGPHNVEFKPVSGWLSPGAKEVVVEKDDPATLNAAYTELSSVTLRINEFMAANSSGSGIKDEDNDFDDWVEIYNATDFDIDMGGLRLGHDPGVLPIPTNAPAETTIPARGYLTFWADRETGEGPLHLDFKLNAGGDVITLYDTDGVTVIDSITFDSQLYNVSYGRFPDGANDWYFFDDPTPNAQNDQVGIANRVEDTKFSPDRGFHDSPFYVTITTNTPGATIYYTIDSTWPIDVSGNPAATAQTYDDNNKPYITTTTNFRAAAVKDGYIPTNVDTHTYIFLDDVLQQPTNPPGYPSLWDAGSAVRTGDYEVDPAVVNHSDPENQLTTSDMQAVPTIVVSMPVDDWFSPSSGLYVRGVPDGTEYPCSFEYFDPEGSGLNKQQNCAMSMQGGISGGGTSLNRWKTPKLSNRPRFKTQTDNGTPTGGPSKLRAKIFPDSPVEDFDTIVLDAVLNHSWHHSSSGQRNSVKYVQDQGVADFHNAMLPNNSPHGAYAHVYINNLYWGMYYIHERPDHSWAAETFGGEKEEYDAVKHGRFDVTGNDIINNGVGGAGAAANFEALRDAARDARDYPGDLARWQNLEQHLDVDNLITYLLAHWFAGLHDWPGKNWYATHKVGGQWRFHTWDAEHSFEGHSNVGQSPEGIHAYLANHDEYRMRWADQIHKHFHHGGPLSNPRSNEIYQARVTQINEAIRGESARWGDLRREPPHVRTEWLSVNTQNGTYLPPRSYTDTNNRGSVYNSLVGARLYSTTEPPDFQVDGSPMFGGYVSFQDDLTITNPGGSGVIWYTTNGNDPRSFGDAVNTAGGALQFTGADIPLTHSIRVKARVLNGAVWSALSDAVFAVGPVAESLRITELMFHPPNAPDGHPDAEYIELKNIGADTINLALVRFTNGVDLELPYMQLAPGDLAVVIKDQVAFESQYDPGGITVVSVPYIGSLDNGGERIELVDALGKTIHNFRYNDTWYLGTDGEGLSLNIRDPYNADLNDWDRRGGWKASSVLKGTPGADDNGVGRGDIVINEVLSHSPNLDPDWIELRNMTDQTIDLGGMYLSDSNADDPNLKKYRIPDGTEIRPMDTPSSYLVFYQNTDFGNPAAADQPFALSENHDAVYLTQVVSGVLTILADEDFGAAEADVSFGRYVKSDLDRGINFVAMTSKTPGTDNTDPKVDRVVINEVAYNPDSDGDAEFVELLNVSGAEITLFDPEHGQWRFVDDPDDPTPGLEIILPSVTLGDGEFFLLVKNKAAFETVFLGGNDISTLGVQWLDWSTTPITPTGSLSNGGEQLELQMPGDLDSDNSRMYIRIDRVTYSDGTHPPGGDPWPVEPDNSDIFTLSRIVADEYGNDVINWQAAIATPAAANPGQ